MAWHKLITFIGTWRKQRKTSTSASLTTLKPLTVWITTNCGKFLKRWEYQTTSPVSWETCMWVKKQQLELGMEQCTGSKLGKVVQQGWYCHPTYLTYMQRVCVCVDVCVCVWICVCVGWVVRSCPTLCNPMDCSPPGSSVNGVFQARIQEWVAIFSSRWSPQTRDQTRIYCGSCIGRQIFYH